MEPSRELIPTSRIGADPFDTEHRLETSQGAGESRETNAESRTGRTNARARAQKKTKAGGQQKKGRKKIKARASAWRNKRNKNRKWRQYKDQSKRETKMERHSPIFTTQESLRYRAETELESCYAAYAHLASFRTVTTDRLQRREKW